MIVPKEERSKTKPGGADGQEESGFLDRILQLFLGLGDPERERKRRLKALAKSFSKDKYKFYKPRGSEIQGDFGRFFYEIYQVVAAAQKLIPPSAVTTSIKRLCIESSLTEEQQELRGRLDEKVIRENAKTTELKTLAEDVKDTVIRFFGTFDAEQTKQINRLYSNVVSFLNFVHHDYYFTLRKFDSAITEGSFTYKPNFDAITGTYVQDDIRDFLEVALALPQDADWNTMFDMLQVYRGVQVIDRDAWKKILRRVVNVLNSGILTRIVQHLSENPDWEPKITQVNERIVEPYLNNIKSETEAVVKKLSNERRNAKLDQLVRQVFGTTVVSRTKHYTENANLMFQKREVSGYRYTAPLNYLKAYLLDYFKKDVRETVQDLLIVRGKWTTNIQATQLSDAYHAVLSVSEQLIRFDEGLAEEGDLGQRLKRAMGRVVEKDPSSTKVLNELLDEINNEAARMIQEGAQNLIIIAKNLKLLIEDMDRKEHEIIINWRQLEGAVEGDLKEQLSQMYRQIYYIVQILQMFVKKPA